jgi:pimeloyl-ACP methyl ester carboxylesterase
MRQLGAFALLWAGERIFLHSESNELKRRMFWGYTMTTDVSMVLRLQAALQYDWPPSLSRAHVPTLVVSSGNDHWMQLREARHLIGRLPCAEHVILPGVGHMSPMVAPDAFNGVVLEFLGRIEGRVL